MGINKKNKHAKLLIPPFSTYMCVSIIYIHF